MFVYIFVILAISVLAWMYRGIKSRPPKICRPPNGPHVASPRIKLRDGRFLAYKERGVEKRKAKHKVVFTHGFNSSKDLYLPLSDELLNELDVCILTYDRAGYGESDPNPKRSIKSDAFDIQELADQLQLGPKFHVMGLSIATYSTWGCLKYIPHRLAGAALVVPLINLWWPSLPSRLCNEAFNKLPPRDRWACRIAHYAPSLFWVVQKCFPCTMLMSLKDFIEKCPNLYNKSDREIFQKMSQIPNANEVLQQGVHESLYRDLLVFYGKWEFDPTELKNPFPYKEGGIHLWQGYEDGMVPFQLQRCVADKVPWIQYHELPKGGHLIIHDGVFCEAILRALLHAV